MKKIIYYPATIFALIGLLMWIILALSGIQYDESGIRGVAFFIGEIFRLPFWAIEEVIFVFNNGESIQGQHVISIVFGLGICIVIDRFLIHKLIRPHK